MKHQWVIFLLIISAATFGFSSYAYSQNTTKATTFILVRHAEKDLTQSTNDPDLSVEGKKTAERLKKLLKAADITTVYTTPFKRTSQTVQPLAEAKNLNLQHYQPVDFSVFRKIVEEKPGEKILVAGHSNTIPAIINFLIGADQYDILADEEYDKVFVVTVNSIGDATVLELVY